MPKFHENRKPWRVRRARAREPCPRPRTALTATTRRRSQRHRVVKGARTLAEEGLDAGPPAIARRELTRVCDQAAELTARHTAAAATRAWMEYFLDYATAKRGRDGTLRTDVSREDVLLAASGIAQSTGQYGTREQAARLIDLLMDALTKGAAATTQT
jgi:hypothetical protein